MFEPVPPETVPAVLNEMSIEDLYPSTMYLITTGTGLSEPEAKRKAMSALSALFEARVSRDITAMAASVTNNRIEDAFRKKISQAIRKTSWVSLEGAGFGETRQSGTTYTAVVVLDKSVGQLEWLTGIEIINARIENEFRTYHALDSPLLRLASANRIQALWIERELVAGRLRVIGSAVPFNCNLNIGDIFVGMPLLRSELRIHIEVSGIDADAANNIIAEAIQKGGFAVSSEKKNAQFRS